MERMPPPAGTASHRGGATILVADDHPTNRMVLEFLLKALGHTPVSAVDGVEALEILEGPRGDTFAAVLMDCHMPNLDGFDSTRFIRARERDLGLARMPILAVTASMDPRDRQQALDAGMDGVLTKPVLKDTLAPALDELLLGTTERGEQGEPGEHEKQETPGDTAFLQVEAAARRLDELMAIGGPSLVREVQTAFWSDALRRADALGDALHRGDTRMLAQAAHALKGASLNVGLPRVARAAAHLERMGKQGQTDGATALLDEVRDALAALDDHPDAGRPATAEGPSLTAELAG